MKKFSQISQLNDPNDNTVSCDYYDLSDFSKVIVTKQDLAVLCLNISSLISHINELKLLLSSLKLNLDILCTTESRITTYLVTESSASATLIYISQKLSYKNMPDLQIYHPKHLESTFIEIILPVSPTL